MSCSKEVLEAARMDKLTKRVFARMEKETRGFRPDYSEILLKKLQIHQNCWCEKNHWHKQMFIHKKLCIEVREFLEVIHKIDPPNKTLKFRREKVNL